MSTSVSTIPDRWRAKISGSSILNQLILFAEGKIDMLPHRAATGIKLIGKILPDLQSVSIEASINHSDLNRLELDAKLIALGMDPLDTWKGLDKPIINHHAIIIDQEPDETINQPDDQDKGTTPMSEAELI